MTITDFHNMQFRDAQLQAAITKTSTVKKKNTSQLLESVNDRLAFLSPLIQSIKSKNLTSRNVHNDTKLNNLLFDTQGKARYVVDLDTVMPGYVHYDLGDALRTAATNLNEDSTDLDNMELNMEGIRLFIEGFITPLESMLDKNEISTLHMAPVYMSLIMGIRFLTDYYNGNIYYKTTYPEQNLHRSMNQIHLAGLFESRADTIKHMISSR
jgi:thiamine kinase-like enzyme